jgi:pimeloyl-ACP methyl ester carboxylesterase
MIKVLKITGAILLLVMVILYILFYNFSAPKSDEKVLSAFIKLGQTPIIEHRSYKDYSYRVVSMQTRLDTSLPTLVFIHGSIGSVMDFKSYLTDTTLLSEFNMLVYDRIGYGKDHTGEVQESIAFEVGLLHDLTDGIDPSNIVLAGYSYGAPVALASKRNYKGLIILAGAVYSEAEAIPWMINFYRWKMTRWMIPMTWKAASKEKLSHADDLKKFEQEWNKHPSKIKVIHGEADWIVPFSNAEYLRNAFPKEQIEVFPIPDAGHALIWSQKDVIIQEILSGLRWFEQ